MVFFFFFNHICRLKEIPLTVPLTNVSLIPNPNGEPFGNNESSDVVGVRLRGCVFPPSHRAPNPRVLTTGGLTLKDIPESVSLGEGH